MLFDTNKNFAQEKAKAQTLGIRAFTLDEVIEAGKQSDVVLKTDEIDAYDTIMLNYTSGTTGDPKGVKVFAWGNIMDSIVSMNICSVGENDVAISYLPSPHVFDQIMFAMILIGGGRVGYYHGDTLALTDDCAVLKPTLFPSVPRLYNKIFAKIQAGLGAATGCKKWIADRAVASKVHYLKNGAHYKHGCYDSLVFGKMAQILGGNVRVMVTASAPISGDVLEFMKICFSCPILEAYGMSETLGAATFTHPGDSI